ncbi:MAG TPA: glycoside hydrolase family 88 protein, partial [Pirellulales bacterium]
SRTVPEAQYLSRWIAMHAPDGVVELVAGPSTGAAKTAAPSLIDALSQPPRATTRVAVTWTVKAGDEQPFSQLAEPLKTAAAEPHQPSDRWLELGRLADRSPREVAQQLARVYGQTLSNVQYIPALALVGRLRLGAATDDPTQRADVERIVAPYLTGQRPALGSKFSGSELAGHLIFSELYDPAHKTEAQNLACVRLVRAVADLGFDAAGQPRQAMPSHSEMSDAVFMGCPILAAAGRLTGEAKYYQMCLRHLRFMRRLTLRTDGLYRHSPLCEAAWGRGNGFPALGLAWTLSLWPATEPGRDEVLGAFRDHVAALLPLQDRTGCWHQVIDHPESYREFSCTCMITWSLARGVRLGLLPRERFDPAIGRGWQAIKLRTQPDGVLVDECVGTGKQSSLRDYFDRPATWGRDDRGGAMALLLATEMLAYERAGK